MNSKEQGGGGNKIQKESEESNFHKNVKVKYERNRKKGGLD